MEPIYRMKFTLSPTDCDCFRRLKPSALMSMMQQAATGQCMQIHLGWDDLARKNLFFALTRQEVRITRLPLQGETITLETWPGDTSRVAYPRSTVAYDADGNELFQAIGLWVLMDLSTRALVLPRESGIIVPGYVRGGELPQPRSLVPKHFKDEAVRRVMFTELDLNGHMNNTRYLDWMMDLLPGSFHREHPLSRFSICYLNEAREGQQVRLQYELDADGALLVEADQNSDVQNPGRVFAIKASFV